MRRQAMRRQAVRGIGGVAAAAMLAACGAKSSAPAAAPATGVPVAAAPGRPAAEQSANAPATTWPATLPAFVPPYPGGRVETAFDGSSAGAASGGMVAFSTADAPERVVSFYRDEAKRSGLGDVATMDAGGAQMFTASDRATHRSLTVQASPDGPRTSVALTYGG